jgi:arylformamidase
MDSKLRSSNNSGQVELGAPDRAFIDAEYDPERRAGPRGPFVEWYIRQSALARETLDCRLDLPYGPTPAETLDLFPSPRPDSPVLLFIHGGYWRALSSKEFSFVARGMVPHGITVAVMNYALCPEVSIAEITRQSRDAVAWLASGERALAGKAARIFAAGHSAGGQQVGMLLSGDRTTAADALKGGIAISGLFDLRPLRHSWLQPTLKLTQESSEEQSPLLNIPKRAPPLLVSVGSLESDALIGQSQRYHAAWREAGLDGEYLLQPGINHYEAVYGLADPESPLARKLADFIYTQA